MRPTPVVRILGGAVSYAGVPVLRGVDVAVHSGEVVALLGPNGSGKSTLLRAVLGLVPLSAGSLEVFGTPGERFGERARIGYVPQHQTVGGGVPATVDEVVSTGRLVSHRWRPWLTGSDRAVVADAIATVGLTEKTRERMSSLSGGQQRRALIARALASQPDLLVMDEPFAGVDVPNQEILAATLSTLVAGDVTLLLATHEIAPIAALVSRTVVVDHGRIRYDGPPTDAVLSYGNVR
jgi:zinc transport system ATP-binding protein